MYIHFYGLEELPFNITPDSRFLFLSQRHKEALAALVYGVKQRKGFIALTGEIGSGKTTICRAFLKELDHTQNNVAIILNSFLTEVELLQSINQELSIPADSQSKKILIDNLNDFLLKEHANGHNTIIIIDEAQNLMPPVLEQIRMLSNLETETDKLIQIILIGQPELESILEIPELEQLNQRISVKYHITPLNLEEISEYIHYRLNVAKAKVKIEFSDAALKLIYKNTGGVPRKINLLCDRILLIGYVEGTTTFDEKIVERAAREIQGGLQNRLIPNRESSFHEEHNIISKSTEQKFNYWALTTILIIFGAMIVLATTIGFYMAKRNVPLPEIVSENKKSGKDAVDNLSDIKTNKENIKTASLSEKTKNDDPLYKSPLYDAPSNPTPTEIPISTPTPKLPEKKIFKYILQYDDDGIVRITHPELSYQACLISWLYLWGTVVDLSGFQDYPLDLIKKFDLAVDNEHLALRKYETEWKLTSIISFDIPVILKLNETRSELTKYKNVDLCEWVLLRNLKGKGATIADPVYGYFVVDRDKLGEKVEKVIIPYFDKEGYANITKSENSSRVKKLQDILVLKEFYKGELSGAFDKNTEKAIRAMQKSYGIQETGLLNEESIIIISSYSFRNRPRLYSE